MKRFTLVTTVFNEMSRLQATISDIEGQTLKPSEIVITDAGSTDGTYEVLQEWAKRSRVKIEVLREKGCNVARGRNMAIRHAAFDLIVSTDFGCRFHPEWLESLVSCFEDPEVRVAGGNFSVLESDLDSWAERAAYICANGYKNKMDDSFLPSSRSIAYYRSVWEAVGGYPEALTLAGDDTTFANELKKKNFRIVLSTRPLVYWLRPSTLSGYLKEAKRYAIGDAENRDPRNFRNMIVNSAEFVLKAAFLLLCAGLITGHLNINLLTGGLFFLSLPGFRSVYRILRRWLGLRSSKYNVKSFFAALVFFDISRLNYLYWYIRTLWSEPGRKGASKEQRVSLN